MKVKVRTCHSASTIRAGEVERLRKVRALWDVLGSGSLGAVGFPEISLLGRGKRPLGFSSVEVSTYDRTPP